MESREETEKKGRNSSKDGGIDIILSKSISKAAWQRGFVSVRQKKQKSRTGGGSMKRRENYIKKRISALTLAGMLAVSVCPLSASAENMRTVRFRQKRHEASSAADLSEDNGGLQEDENKSAAAEGTEGEKFRRRIGSDRTGRRGRTGKRK